MNTTISNTTNATASATSSPPPLGLPADLSSIITLLVSFSALRDWLKLLIIGGFFETCRRIAFSCYHRVVDSFFITATFEEDDSSYEWMMVWLSKRPSWSTAREVQISTKSFGLNSNAVSIPGDEQDTKSSMNTRSLSYLPSVHATHSIWYKRHWMTITRVQKQTGYYGSKEETLQIRILARGHRILNELLIEAKKEYVAAEEHFISIYASDSRNGWRHVAFRSKRSLNSIVLDPGVKDLLVDDARDFLESKSWYAARGIPFRRGYLLYGAPGSGKTSIIHSLAGELGLDVYVISLSRAGMDDAALSELISDLPEKCIALMEDIDAAFTHSVNRDAEVPQTPAGPPNQQAPAPPPSSSRLSLSGLLNALDGVGAQEGRILFATTNKYSALDPALCRPGRMDIHVEFKLASKYQAAELFRCFYLPEGEDNVDEKKAVEIETSDPTETIDDETSSQSSESTVVNSPASEKPSYRGYRHRVRAPKLSRQQVAELAASFAEAIPEREISMASLQGFLMTYKSRPYEAIKQAAAWVETGRQERAKKASVASSATATQSTTTPTTTAPIVASSTTTPSTTTTVPPIIVPSADTPSPAPPSAVTSVTSTAAPI